MSGLSVRALRPRRWARAVRALALVLVTVCLSCGLAGESRAAALRAEETLSSLPPASVLCISPPDTTTPADALAGRCGARTAKLPAEVWFRFEMAAGEGEALLIATENYTTKGGSLSIWTSSSAPRTVRTDDPIARRTVRDSRPALPIRLTPGAEVQVAARLVLRDSRHLQKPYKLLQLTTPLGWAEAHSRSTFGQGLFMGLLLIMAMYSAFHFYAERYHASGWGTAALVVAALYLAVAGDMGALFLWPFMPRLTQLLDPILPTLLCALALRFTRASIQLGRRGERAMRLAALACWFTTLFSVVIDHLDWVALSATVDNVVLGGSLLVLLISTGATAWRGDRTARIVLCSFLAPVAGAFAQIGLRSGLLQSSPILAGLPQIGFAVQVLILGLVTADRVRQLRSDRDRSETVLRLALPTSIAERLKAGETSIADYHAEVAVLFADLAGFTRLSAARKPEDVVRLLDALFSECDRLAVRYGAEKIKTIGDCYMAVAGAPHPHADPTAALAELALQLPGALERALASVRASSATVTEGVALRIGLHVGPVVAGVLGQQKLAYDLWGDTVNTASRMESHGIVGRIQCTEEVVSRLRDNYRFELRGDIEVRGKGSIRTWLLLGRNPKGQTAQGT